MKSAFLLISYPVLIMGIIWIIAALIGVYLSPQPLQQVSFDQIIYWGNATILQYGFLILGGIALWFSVAYLFHTKMMRGLSHSRPVFREQEPKIYNMLENLCISRGMNTPHLEIIETDAMNAFASGIDEPSFTVTLTRGLIDKLDDDEIEAVIAHELTHIINRDVRLLVISIIFTGMLGLAAQILWSNMRYQLYFGGRSSRKDKNGGSLLIIVIVISIVVWLGYMATMLTRFTLSRKREFLADAGAIELTKNPEAMMRALLKISGNENLAEAPADIAMMCIENRKRFLGVFATHPPIMKRVRAISQTTNTPIEGIMKKRKQKTPWHVKADN